MFIFFCWSWVLNWGSHACTGTFTKWAVFSSPQHFFKFIFIYEWNFRYECFTCILHAFMYVYRLCLVLQRPEEVIGSLDIGITGGSELPCVCWELNMGILQEQPLVLISESSLQFPSPPHPQISKLKVIYNVLIYCGKQGRGCINSWKGTDCPCGMSAPSHSNNSHLDSV